MVDHVYRELPRAAELLPHRLVKMASSMFAGVTGLSGPQLFSFFGRYSDAAGKMRYGSGLPSRWMVFENFLESLPIDLQHKALLELCDYPMSTLPSAELIQQLKAELQGAPVPASLRRAVERIDSLFVRKQWEKLSERLVDDPEGAITSARTLVETVCLHILDGLGRACDHKGDLPMLYKATANGLGLMPEKADDEIVRQVLGSCAGIAQGIASLRNQFGDAHGRFGKEAERRLAHLAANVAGALCTFLIETYEARSR